MGFLDTSVVTSTVVKQGTTAVASAQNSIAASLPTISNNVTTSISTTVKGATTGLSAVTSLTTGTTNTAQKLESAAINIASKAASSYIQSALKSVTSTFGGSKTGLASGISTSLSKIFGNTNVASASTTTTRISDPVSTLLSKKTVTSTPFTLSSLVAGSQSIGMAGSTSVAGTGASTMTSPQLSTILNRLNLDSINNLGSNIVSSLASGKLNGLFGTLTASPTSGTSVKDTLASNALGGVTLPGISTNNELQEFLGNTSSVQSALGGTDLSQYFLPNTSYSLVDQNGTPVDTNKSGVDSTLANALLSVMSLTGCSTSTTNYGSASGLDSLFNMLLSLFAKNGMGTEVNSLLGCSSASTVSGQQSLVNAFIGSSNTQIGTSKSILDSIQTPSALNTDFVAKSIVTNKTLDASSVPTVDYMFATIGTTTKTAMSVPGISTDQYTAYDASILSASPTSFVDGVFGDPTISNYLNGTQATVSSDGTLNFF